MPTNQPGLFGITHSNRNFSLKESWGKNQFNSSFPAALSSYLAHRNFDNIYIVADEELNTVHETISTESFFGITPTSDDLFFAFEAQHAPYQQLVIGSLPRVDLVTQKRSDSLCLQPIEIKLTALPDNSTCNLEDDKFGSEIVVRPDTIVYLACSFALKFRRNRQILRDIFAEKYDSISDWTEPRNIQPFLRSMVDDLNSICNAVIDDQTPLVMQPIWKTIGKSPKLSDNCLDVFIWSDIAFTRLFVDSTLYDMERERTNITRQSRTTVWLFKMLFDFSLQGQIDYRSTIDSLSFNTKNDKAFALSGKVTHKYMASDELTNPRITKSEVKNIILGGGQSLLSPERRFDAIIYNSIDLFE